MTYPQAVHSIEDNSIFCGHQNEFIQNVDRNTQISTGNLCITLWTVCKDYIMWIGGVENQNYIGIGRF